MICALPFLMLVPVLPATSPSVDEIVCRVAENQQRAESARKQYVYDMNVFLRMKRANGKVAREEIRDYVVVPSEKGAKRSMVRLDGKIFEGKTVIPYATPDYKHKRADIDADVTDSFARSIMWHKRTMGIYLNWFPLDRDYEYKLEGEERYKDFDVYKLSFKEAEGCWSGEALVERHEFQPVLITSTWACKVPKAVTILMGISVSQMGAKITYQRFDKDVWFPSVSGGELKFRVAFLYARTMAFSAKNSGFRKTDVKTSLTFEADEDTLDIAPPPH